MRKSVSAEQTNVQFEQLRLQSRAKCLALARNRELSDSCLFFVPVRGLDVERCARRVAELAGFRMATAENQDDEAEWLAQEHKYAARMWELPGDALLYLLAKQETNLLLAMPPDPHHAQSPAATRHAAEERPCPPVWVYTRSPVEDIYVNVMLMLHGRMNKDEVDFVRRNLDLRWRMLRYRAASQCRMWIYLRLDERPWARLLARHKACGVSDAELARMNGYRELMDELFRSNHKFIKQNHSLVINLHTTDLDSDMTCHEIAKIVAEFIMAQFDVFMWRPFIPWAAWLEHLRSVDYHTGRERQAVAARMHAAPGNGAAAAAAGRAGADDGQDGANLPHFSPVLKPRRSSDNDSSSSASHRRSVQAVAAAPALRAVDPYRTASGSRIGGGGGNGNCASSSSVGSVGYSSMATTATRSASPVPGRRSSTPVRGQPSSSSSAANGMTIIDLGLSLEARTAAASPATAHLYGSVREHDSKS